MIIGMARQVCNVGMGSPSVTIGVAVSNVCVASRIEGLHLHKSEGARTIKAPKGKVRDVGQRSTLSLHESLHALILAAARPAINTHPIAPKDSSAHAAKHMNNWVMACGGKADAVRACDGVATDGGDGGVGY